METAGLDAKALKTELDKMDEVNMTYWNSYFSGQELWSLMKTLKLYVRKTARPQQMN